MRVEEDFASLDGLVADFQVEGESGVEFLVSVEGRVLSLADQVGVGPDVPLRGGLANDARCMPVMDACRILMRSISSGVTSATAHAIASRSIS